MPIVQKYFSPIENRYLTVAVFAMVILMALLWNVKISVARDNGQWEGSNPEIRQWYQTLKQPDAPSVSCCGEADSYWCDDIHVRDGKTYCRITDNRPDGPLGRPHREIGKEYEIPPQKNIREGGNPTGHSIIFLSSADYVWCFAQDGSI